MDLKGHRHESFLFSDNRQIQVLENYVPVEIQLLQRGNIEPLSVIICGFKGTPSREFPILRCHVDKYRVGY